MISRLSIWDAIVKIFLAVYLLPGDKVISRPNISSSYFSGSGEKISLPITRRQSDFENSSGKGIWRVLESEIPFTYYPETKWFRDFWGHIKHFHFFSKFTYYPETKWFRDSSGIKPIPTLFIFTYYSETKWFRDLFPQSLLTNLLNF